MKFITILTFLKSNGPGLLFAKRSSGAMTVRMAGMAMAFIVQIVLARLLGVDEYGLYIYVLTWLNVLLLPAMWGWSSSTIKYMSIYYIKQEWPLMKGYMVTALFLPVMSSVLLAVVIYLVIWLCTDLFDERLTSVFVLGLFLLPFNVALAIAGSGMQGLKNIVKAQLPQAIYRPLLLVFLIVVGAFQLNLNATAEYAMYCNIIAAVFLSIFAWSQLVSALPFKVSEYGINTKFKEWSSVAFPLLLVSGFALLMKQFDIIMLGFLVDTTSAGVYSVATRISELTSFGLTTINMVLAPIIAEQFAQGNKGELQRYSAFAAVGVSVFTIPIALIAIIYGDPILNIFGDGFSAGYSSMIILVCAHVVNASVGAVGYYMTMTGHQGVAARTMALGAALNICLNILLIPLYGTVGAAIATGIAMVTWNMVMLYHVRKYIGIDTTVFSILRLLK